MKGVGRVSPRQHGPARARVRTALLGTAATWAAGWSVVGLALGIWESLGSLGSVPFHIPVVGSTVVMGFAGLMAGGLFSSIMVFAERRSTISDLTLPRVAVWGFFGGLPIALLNFTVALYLEYVMPGGMGIALLSTGVLGAVFATGSVAVARYEEPLLFGRAAGHPGSRQRERVSEPKRRKVVRMAQATPSPSR
jgi:hypothetical protein